MQLESQLFTYCFQLIIQSIRDVEEMRLPLVETWTEFQQSIVDEAIEDWRKRLCACFGTNGDHFQTCFFIIGQTSSSSRCYGNICKMNCIFKITV